MTFLIELNMHGYSDTVYDYSSTVTILPGPDGVTDGGHVCSEISEKRVTLIHGTDVFSCSDTVWTGPKCHCRQASL